MSVLDIDRPDFMKDEDIVIFEDAVGKLGMFEFSRLPQMTHGICKDCFAGMLKDVSTALPLQSS